MKGRRGHSVSRAGTMLTGRVLLLQPLPEAAEERACAVIQLCELPKPRLTLR
jgi:hypothetical protein